MHALSCTLVDLYPSMRATSAAHSPGLIAMLASTARKIAWRSSVGGSMSAARTDELASVRSRTIVRCGDWQLSKKSGDSGKLDWIMLARTARLATSATEFLMRDPARLYPQSRLSLRLTSSTWIGPSISTILVT